MNNLKTAEKVIINNQKLTYSHYDFMFDYYIFMHDDGTTYKLSLEEVIDNDKNAYRSKI